MVKKIIYQTKGVCSNEIEVNIENNIVQNVSFKGGCNGNLKAISKLVSGMSVEEVIKTLKGIDCKGKGTSCADQLCIALEVAINQKDSD